MIAAGIDGYREGRDAAALGALPARAAHGELRLVAVHPEPLVVVPAELGWTAMVAREHRNLLIMGSSRRGPQAEPRVREY